MIDSSIEKNVSFKPLIVGFLLSIALTLAAFIMVVFGFFFGLLSDIILLGLAFFQALVQLIFFFHLGSEAKPRFKLMMFFFMLLIVTIVVTGSIWIMKNLDYNLMVDMSY